MNNKALIWGVVVLLLLIVSFVGYFAFQFLGGGLSTKPHIILLQPVEPQTIENTEGIVFITATQAEKGIDRIEFLVNGILSAKRYPEPGSATELLSQIAWVPTSGVGVYDLSFIAYDTSGAASEPARITIGVISKGLSQTNVDEIINAVANSEPSQVASGGMAGGGGADAQPGRGNQQDALDGDHGVGEGAEMQFIEVEGDINQIRPFDSDLPPEFIGPFAFEITREAGGVLVTFTASAQDDHHAQNMYIVGEVVGALEAPISLAKSCMAENPCTISGSALLQQGSHTIRAVAVDDFGQFTMHSESHVVEVSANPLVDELPAVIEQALQGGLLDPQFMAGLVAHVGGRFQMQPFLGLGLPFGGENEEEVPNCAPNCPPTSLADVRVFVDQFYDEQFHPRLVLTCIFPPNLQTEVEDPTLGVIIPELYDSGFPSEYCRTPLTLDVLTNGTINRENLRIDEPSQRYCGVPKTSFSPIIAIKNWLGDLDVVEQENPVAEVVPLKCPPSSPVFISLEATKNCPANNQDDKFCLIVKWEPVVNNSDQLAINSLLLTQSNLSLGGNIITTEFPLGANETSFIQREVQPGWVYEFHLYSVAEEGIRSAAAKINIRVPRPMDDPYRISTDWRENR